MFSKGSSRRVGVSLAGLLVVVGLVAAIVPVQAITYGQADTAHPFVGAIVVQGDAGWTSEFCSGTLIAPRVFLTAGHCTSALWSYVSATTQVHISFGPNVLTTSTWHAVDSWVTSPDYWWGPMSDPHDVGVIILQDPVTDLGFGHLAPAAGFLNDLGLNGKLVPMTTKFLNVGYGTDQNQADTNVREFSWSAFKNLHAAWIYLSQNARTGNAGTCYGDSGGPTFWVDGGTEYVVAVTSWGDSPCKSTNNNYRVDTAESLAFLNGVMAQAAT